MQQQLHQQQLHQQQLHQIQQQHMQQQIQAQQPNQAHLQTSMALPPQQFPLPNQNSMTVLVGPTPALTDTQRLELDQYIQRDEIFAKAFENQKQMQTALINEKQQEIRQLAQAGSDVFGPGYSGYGNGSTGTQFHIIYPADRRRSRKTKEFIFTKASMEEQAQKDDVLVPIRLEIDVDGLILRDTFTWNLYESLITPEQFAEVLCEDMQFPALQFAPQIAKSVREQLQDYHLPALAVETLQENKETAEEDSKPVQELRILIKIDVTVANTSLVDQFEWDISCPNNDPERFAEVLTAELGLGGEFTTAIAHSIREQVQTHTKCLNLIGYNYDGSSVHDEDLRGSFLPKITTILREEEAVEQFTPILEKLTEPEIDKLERDRERDKRRKRRQTRGRRGVILPDREPTKTKRTLLHHGQTIETMDPSQDPQQHDPSLSNRAGPTTRRTAMAHDYSTVSFNVTPQVVPPTQSVVAHHRVTRKLRGSGSDLSVHHPGLAGASGLSSFHSRENMHGSKDKLINANREQHAQSPIRETTPVQNYKDANMQSPNESRTPQANRHVYAMTPEPNGPMSPPPPPSRRPAPAPSSTNSPSHPSTSFIVAENLPKSLSLDQARLQQLYPSDRFEILIRANGGVDPVALKMGTLPTEDYRVRCLECPPGKLYNSGPDGTLQNFEVHLKSNKAHRSYVEQKKQQPQQQGTQRGASLTQSSPVSTTTPTLVHLPQPTPQQSHNLRQNGVGLGIEG
ncbi:SWI/SNF chromatin-remodeling complex subunit [Podila epicladia]|nr:SWI/SNF chromatin-remodeling complex subunit [Podila epicladia]